MAKKKCVQSFVIICLQMIVHTFFLPIFTAAKDEKYFSRKFVSVKSKVDYSWKVCGLLRIFELYTALWGEAILIKATFEMHLVACPVVDLASINLVEKGQTGLHRPSMWKYCLALFTQEDIPLFSFTNGVKSFLKNQSYFY